MNSLERSGAMALNRLSGQEQAEQAAVTRVLNCFLLESGKSATAVDPLTKQLRLYLPSIGVYLAGEVVHQSVMGHHAYRYPLVEEKPGNGRRPLSCREAIGLVLQELCAMHPAPDAEARSVRLQKQVDNSMAHMQAYWEHALRQSPPLVARRPLVAAEQSLRCGHPLHPTPKSAEGWEEEDLQAYAPELGVSFQLHYWAVHQEELVEDWLNAETSCGLPPIPEEAREAAAQLLGEEKDKYALLPVHPWQSHYLQVKHDEAHAMIGERRIVPLGEAGPVVYPTSSVRTVWSPEQGWFIKLPLHVRITNFIRVNTCEQMARTMDAARICAMLRTELETDSLGLLLEYGYRGVNRDSLFAELAVVYRESPATLQEQGERWFPVASLLEPEPDSGRPLLWRHLTPAARSKPLDWVAQYTRVFLVPVLDAFARLGLSLEAHVQNSLIRLDPDGMPVECLIRDLEGVSMDRRRAAELGWIGKWISADSPVLYGREAAFERLLYYAVTNHMGHLLAVVARHAAIAEWMMWQKVRHVLVEEAAQRSSPLFAAVVAMLQERESLPAKANLLSQLYGRGETPLYISVPNMLCERGAGNERIRG